MRTLKHTLVVGVSCIATLACSTSVKAQTIIVGTGGEYESLFSNPGDVSVNPPDGGLLTLEFGGSTGPTDVEDWTLSAQGGAGVSVAGLGLLETGAQTALTGNSLQFNVTDNNDSLVGLLGINTTITTSWAATYTFDTPGSEVGLTANTLYQFSFDYDGQNGLLDNTLNLNPTLTFELLDGSGNPIDEALNGSLINLVGLLGGTGSGTANFSFTTGDTVAAGPASIRFTGSADLNATALGLGTQFAEFSGMQMTAAPVPEPAGALLFIVGGTALLIFRRPLRTSRA